MADDRSLPAWLPLFAEAGVQKSALPWPRAWAVVARAEVRCGSAWARSVLWRWRLWAFVRTLRGARRCVACGAPIETDDPRAKHCSPACRAAALRARKADKPTTFEALLDHADAQFLEADGEVRESERWLDHAVRRKTPIPPPHLLEYEHLPELPARCGRCGTSECCQHTGGTCLHVYFERTPPAQQVRRTNGP